MASPDPPTPDDGEVSKNERHIQWFREFFDEYYREQLDTLEDRYDPDDVPSLTIDYRQLQTHNDGLATALSRYPDQLKSAAEDALQEMLVEAVDTSQFESEMSDSHDSPEDTHAYKEYVRNLNEATIRVDHHDADPDNVLPIRNIRSKHINQMVTVEGIVKTTSRVLPRVVSARFRCRSCGGTTTVSQPSNPNKLDVPYKCPTEGCEKTARRAFEMDKARSKQVDFQKIVIEEAPEDLKGGQSPQGISAYIRGDITGEVTPGDRISLTGTLRADNKDDNPVFTTFFEGNYIAKEEKEYEEIEISDEDIAEIKRLSNLDDIHERVRDSVAPSIYGYPHQKMAVGLQLFSGVTKTDGNHIRGDIHVLFVGDPGTGKSRVIESAKEISPRGIYTVGKGSSAAGLTAAVVQESDISGEQKYSLEAGALVLADKGIACVDEVDKMRDSDRSALHEALEQQTVSINKAGINATLKSRCSMLAAANPTYGRFDQYEAIGEQIDLEPALISRFDLIFTILDEPDKEKDGNLADHIMQSNVPEDKADVVDIEDAEDSGEPAIDHELLRKYIAYARQNYDPVLTEEAHDRIREFYVNLRDGGGEEGPIATTARAVQSLVRVAEAHARIELKEEVELEDAEAAINIKVESLEDVGMDENGNLDADKMETNTSSTQRDRIRGLQDLLKELSEKNPDEGVHIDDLLEQAEEDLEMKESDVRDELKKFQRRGDVMEPSIDHYLYISN